MGNVFYLLTVLRWIGELVSLGASTREQTGGRKPKGKLTESHQKNAGRSSLSSAPPARSELSDAPQDGPEVRVRLVERIPNSICILGPAGAQTQQQ